jgi:prephenate dehydratase
MNDQKLKLTIKEVKDLGSSVRVLGSYPQYI